MAKPKGKQFIHGGKFKRTFQTAPALQHRETGRGSFNDRLKTLERAYAEVVLHAAENDKALFHMTEALKILCLPLVKRFTPMRAWRKEREA